jgi:hypothetical protein
LLTMTFCEVAGWPLLPFSMPSTLSACAIEIESRTKLRKCRLNRHFAPQSATPLNPDLN